MESICLWLSEHAVICTWIVALCAVLTFVFNFILKKKKEHSQNISDVHDSTINQAGGNITNILKDA